MTLVHYEHAPGKKPEWAQCQVRRPTYTSGNPLMVTCDGCLSDIPIEPGTPAAAIAGLLGCGCCGGETRPWAIIRAFADEGWIIRRQPRRLHHRTQEGATP